MSQSKAIDGYFAFIFVACYLCDCRLSPTKSNKIVRNFINYKIYR